MGEHCGPVPCAASISLHAPLFGAAILLGLSDCSFQTQTSAVISEVYTQQSADGFAVFRTLQAIAAMACFLVTPAISSNTYSSKSEFALLIGITAANMVLALMGFALFQRSLVHHKRSVAV
eukprot:NODE_8071_length_424_cov_11.728000_g7608_i0.p1 GENE.NODE_8071_length_424_cov_11.728000_g7608_i0~~NODE_8071_length_424_cov_11.728000_g7608_i0.p1  ORF type:complete len:121 (-),score=18.73 NODE_8071_length_424_cov_11.728000_g7608_i0:35-397(-)